MAECVGGVINMENVDFLKNFQVQLNCLNNSKFYCLPQVHLAKSLP